MSANLLHLPWRRFFTFFCAFPFIVFTFAVLFAPRGLHANYITTGRDRQSPAGQGAAKQEGPQTGAKTNSPPASQTQITPKEKDPFIFEPVFSINNFTLSVQETPSSDRVFVNFNRLRADLSLSNSWLKFHFIGDNENYLSERKFSLLATPGEHLPIDIVWNVRQKDAWLNRFYLYRAYSEIVWANSTFSLGLHRVPFGVGRIWTPTDTFNPLNTVSLEPSERVGVLGGIWTMHFGEFTRIMAVTAADENWNAGTNALHVKSFIAGMDIGATYVYAGKFQMAGYEFEANFFDTGAEIRSEGGYFFNIANSTYSLSVTTPFPITVNYNEKEENFFKGILGIDRSFGDDFTAAIEYLYNGAGKTDKKDYPPFPKDPLLFDNAARHYLGGSISYQATPLLTLSAAATVNLIDYSYFIAPSVLYSLSDEAALSAGALFFDGRSLTEYGSLTPTYYLKLDWFF